MKVLIFADTHGDMLSLEAAKQKAEAANLVICLGDLTFFGEDLDALLAFVNTFPKRVIMMHGNHEDEEAVQLLCKKYDNLTFAHAEMIVHEGYSFLVYGGDGFSRVNYHFEEIAQEFSQQAEDNNKAIILLHGPPANTTLDEPYEGYHCGSESYRAFIESYQPLASFSGHVHEGEKLIDYIDNTTLFNPGPDGEIIDLEALYHEREQKVNKNKIIKQK